MQTTKQIRTAHTHTLHTLYTHTLQTPLLMTLKSRFVTGSCNDKMLTTSHICITEDSLFEPKQKYVSSLGRKNLIRAFGP